jgi:hypothetical protein
MEGFLNDPEEYRLTGIFTKYWADRNAQKGKYSEESEVFSFACLSFYILFGTPIFSKE